MGADATENSDIFSEMDPLDFDFSDNLTISLESLFAILDEEPEPFQSRSPGMTKGFHQGKLAPGQVDPEKAFQPETVLGGGTLESTAAVPEASTELECSRWNPSNFLGFESQGTNNICYTVPIDNGNLRNSQLFCSKNFCSCSSNLSFNCLEIPSSERHTCSMESVGGSFNHLITVNFDQQQLQNNIQKYISPPQSTEGEGISYSQWADFVNNVHLDIDQEKGFEHEQMGSESSSQVEIRGFTTGSSHTMVVEKSGSTDGMHGNMNISVVRLVPHSGVQEGNMCPSPFIYFPMDPDATLPDIADSVNTSDTSSIHSDARDSCLTLPRHTTIGAENALQQILPGQFFQPFISRENEAMVNMTGEREDELLACQKFCTGSVVKLGTQEESLDMSLPEVHIIDMDSSLPDIPCAEQYHCQDMNFKCESSTDSSQVPSSSNATFGIIDRSVVNSSKQLEPDSKIIISNKNQKVFSKDEKEDQMLASRRKLHHYTKGFDDGIKKNPSRSSFHVDDDADICILDDISDPVHPPPPVVHIKSHPISQRPGVIDPHHPGTGGMRLKADDERLTFRIALQDLSQPKSEASPPDGVLAVPLLRHQRIALSWMAQKETGLQCSGGILADDQGLGKTISTIALILSERSPSSRSCSVAEKQGEFEALNLDDDDVSGLNVMKQPQNSSPAMIRQIKRENFVMVVKGRPAAGTLVVCPTSVLRQWAEELRNKVTSKANLSFVVYHGSNRTKDPSELAKYDVVLTTYSIVSMEVPKQPLDRDDEEKGKLDASGLPVGPFTNRKRKSSPSCNTKNLKNSKTMDSALLESAARPLGRVVWFRVILDEAQCIKNHRTQVARACWGLRAKRRWCLSGTPIQNAVDDLYNYFRFLRYDPYAVYRSFCSKIKLPITTDPTNGYRKLQAVLKTIMLRRTKGTLIDGDPIITLPPKTVSLKKVDFSKEERVFYSILEAESQEQFKVYAASGTVKQNYVNILLMLLRLRQACDHPLLVKRYDSNSIWRSYMETTKKLPRNEQIHLLSCLEACLAICTICNGPPEDAVVTICGHVFCNQCICEHLTGDDNICPSANCKVGLGVASVFSRGTLKSSLSGLHSDDCSPGNSGPELVDTPNLHEGSLPSGSSKIKAALMILQSLPKSQHSTSKGNFEKYNGGASDSSENVYNTVSVSPMDIDDEKHSDSEKGSNALVAEKAIVFSQWTRMLDLFEVPLRDSCIHYRRLDGTMSVAAREKAIKDFNTLPEVTVMIMSLKAASLGLNMVAASHVLLLDLWWNPTTEDQAIDRAHRIGQTRPVIVSRLTVKDTVEDRILALQASDPVKHYNNIALPVSWYQSTDRDPGNIVDTSETSCEKKRELVASAFGEDESGSLQSRLTVEDLKYLFMA